MIEGMEVGGVSSLEELSSPYLHRRDAFWAKEALSNFGVAQTLAPQLRSFLAQYEDKSEAANGWLAGQTCV